MTDTPTSPAPAAPVRPSVTAPLSAPSGPSGPGPAPAGAGVQPVGGLERARARSVRRAFAWSVAAVLVAFVLVETWAAIEARGPAARVQELMPVIGAERVERPLSEAERAMPIERADGSMTTLDALPADTLVFLNFWATWCEPCVRELPSMLALRRELAGRPFRMVAISYDDSWDAVNGFFQRVMGGSPRELVLLRDPNAAEGTEEQLLRTQFGTRKLPESYVIRNGRVLARFVNARDWTDASIVEYFERLSEVR